MNRPSRRSVFDHALAHDVAAFLTAILHPYDEAKVKRALLGRMIGLDLSTLQHLQQQASGLSQYMTQFDAVREIWMHQGFTRMATRTGRVSGMAKSGQNPAP